jgi:putative nucleotidyltransferase with HDIG domain
MSPNQPTYEQALALLKQYNQGDNLIKHALAVAAVMRHFAELWEEDASTWEVVGLIHDLDYEQFPDQHCAKTGEILRQEGWPEDLIRAVQSHGWGICTEIEPQTRMEKNALRRGRTDRPDRRRGPGPPQQERTRRQGEVRQEEVEGKGLCSRRQSRNHSAGGRPAGDGSE